MGYKTVKVSFPAWAESGTSWKLLTKRSPNGKGWSGASWFPKTLCSLRDSPEEGVGILTLPEWLFNLKSSNEGLEFTNLNNEII